MAKELKRYKFMCSYIISKPYTFIMFGPNLESSPKLPDNFFRIFHSLLHLPGGKNHSVAPHMETCEPSDTWME